MQVIRRRIKADNILLIPGVNSKTQEEWFYDVFKHDRIKFDPDYRTNMFTLPKEEVYPMVNTDLYDVHIYEDSSVFRSQLGVVIAAQNRAADLKYAPRTFCAMYLRNTSKGSQKILFAMERLTRSITLTNWRERRMVITDKICDKVFTMVSVLSEHLIQKNNFQPHNVLIAYENSAKTFRVYCTHFESCIYPGREDPHCVMKSLGLNEEEEVLISTI